MSIHSTFYKIIAVRTIGVLCLAVLTYSASSGQTLANWPFGVTGTSPSTVNANTSAPIATYTTPSSNTSIVSSRFRAQGWNIAAFDATRFFEIDITPNTSYSITVTSVVVNLDRSTNGPTSYEARISTDDFSTFASIGSGTVTTTATNVTLSVSSVVQAATTVKVRIYFWGASGATDLISIGSAAINGTVQSPPLPVELVSFQGRSVANSVQLNWATASERFADRFVVQRSQNAAEFVEVGTLPAAGNTDGQRTYTLTDEQPTNGANYYRLKQIDQDGSVNYSKIIAVTVRADQPSIQVYPNPSDGRQFQLQVRNLIAPTASIQTLTGQTIQGRWMKLTDTEATWQPDTALAPGLYLLSVRDGAIRQAVKVLVQ